MMQLLTIIIATYNRSDKLPEVFNSILNQESNGTFDYELLLIDNNSTDQTKEIVLSFVPKFKNKLKYIVETKQGKTSSVNTGIQLSKGEIIVITDDDVVADRFWLVHIVECFKKYNCDGLGGRVLVDYLPNTPQWVKDNADILVGPIVSYDYGEDVKPYAKPMYEFVGANLALKKSVILECGGMRADIGPGQGTLGDDTEFIKRFFKAGKKLYYCGNALVWHPAESNRVNLKYIGQWNVGLGRYRFLIDENSKIDLTLKYYFGIPRYLIFKMLKSCISLIGKTPHKRAFLITWIDLCRDWGKSLEMRKVYLKNK